MAELTTTSYLILGLLSSRDWSAYELAEQIGRGVTEIWPRADRQLYDAPKRLVENGLATARREASAGRRQRTVYSITPEGRDAMRAWLATAPHPPALEFEGMVRVLFADMGSVDDLRATLQTIIDQAQVVRELFQRHATLILETDGGTFPERQHLFALSNRFVGGYFLHIEEWASWALEQIESWPDTTTPAETHKDQTRAVLRAAARARRRRRL
jgi:DNA-binding PadR family transcriptional regulator